MKIRVNRRRVNYKKYRQPASRCRRALAVAAVSVASAIVAYLALLLFTAIASLIAVRFQIDYWRDWQAEHVAALAEAYSQDTAEKADEQAVCDFDIAQAEENGAKLNQLRLLATHNSYKQRLSSATEFLYRAAGSYYKYGYWFDDLTTQLNGGVRGLELDLYSSDEEEGGLAVLHNSLLDGGSSAINFGLALTELKMWSDYNPGHMPVVVLIEAKSVGAFGYGGMSTDDMLRAEEMLGDIFGDSLYTPAEALEGYSDFAELRADDGYPTIAETAGRFIFLIHESSAAYEYMGMEGGMRSRKMFFAADLYSGSDYEDMSMFALVNNFTEGPGWLGYERALAENFIIRTRIDDVFRSEARNSLVLSTAANIITTDYPPSAESRNGYAVYVAQGNKTMSLIGCRAHGCNCVLCNCTL